VFSFGIALWDLGLLMTTPAEQQQPQQTQPNQPKYYIPPALKESDTAKQRIPDKFFPATLAKTIELCMSEHPEKKT